MLKKDLINSVASDTKLSKQTIRQVMDSILETTTKALVAGDSVMVFGLGRMSISKRGPKQARNIHTGEIVIVPPRIAVVMAPSDPLVKAVNAAVEA